eukprot:gene11981-10495_t
MRLSPPGFAAAALALLVFCALPGGQPERRPRPQQGTDPPSAAAAAAAPPPAPAASRPTIAAATTSSSASAAEARGGGDSPPPATAVAADLKHTLNCWCNSFRDTYVSVKERLEDPGPPMRWIPLKKSGHATCRGVAGRSARSGKGKASKSEANCPVE